MQRFIPRLKALFLSFQSFRLAIDGFFLLLNTTLVALNLTSAVPDFLFKIISGLDILLLGLKKCLALLRLCSRQCLVDDRSCLLLRASNRCVVLLSDVIFGHRVGHRNCDHKGNYHRNDNCQSHAGAPPYLVFIVQNHNKTII